MTLGDKQRQFAHMVALLILHAEALGYGVTLGDAFRDPRAFFPYGHPQSFHKSRLAIDINLFRRDADGKWQYLSATEDHEPLGLYWESIGGTWGGRFQVENEAGELVPKPDGNHYSLGEAR